jgi:hypothetical protein
MPAAGSSERPAWWLLQRTMPAFVATILLGVARLDAFNANSESEPPDGELTQIEQGVSASEGNAVVAADVGRQAALSKKPLKHSKSVVSFGRRKSHTGEEITAGMIGDGQRLAIFMIAEQEFAFVIGAPEFIGSFARG